MKVATARRPRRGTAGLVAALLAGVAAPAMAQTAETPVPAPRSPNDANGVNLANGQLEFDDVPLTIGQGQASMSFVRHWFHNGWRHDYVGTIRISGSRAVVSIGGEAWTFTASGGGWLSDQQDGTTLTGPSGNATYRLVTATGAVATFDASLVGQNTSYGGSVTAVLTTMRMPDFEQLDFDYRREKYGRGVPNNGGSAIIDLYVLRLQSVRNSYGFQLKFAYQSDDVNDTDGWARIGKVTAINNAFEVCPPTANGCTLANVWPSLTFAGLDGEGGTETVTDALSRKTTYTHGGGALITSVKGPRSEAATREIYYDYAARVQRVQRSNISAVYDYSDVNGVLTTKITDALNHEQLVKADTMKGVVLEQMDALGRRDRFGYDDAGRLITATTRTGVITDWERDSRGNATQVTVTPAARDGQTLPRSITTYATFDACTGANALICNSPRTTTDALGGVTDYYYSTNHAGAERIVRPAPSAGAPRPELRMGWAPYTARYLDAAGTMGPGTSSAWLQVRKSACPSGAGCVGTESEVLTQVEYNDPAQQSAPNNLYPRKVTSGSGNGTLQAVTVTTYDRVGNVATIDGPLADSADTSRMTWDAARQLIQATGPDPDGPGSLKNRSVKYDRNADGQTETTRTGTANADGSGFAELSRETTTYDALGRSIAQRLEKGGSKWAASETSYDAAGRVECRVVRMNRSDLTPGGGACAIGGMGADGPDRVTKYAYDIADALTEVRDAVGVSTSDWRTPDAASTGQVLQSTVYDGFGQVASLADARGNTTRYTYDGFDRVKRTTYADNSYEEAGYDDYGRQDSLKLRDGKEITFGYDALSRRISTNRPLTAANETNQAYGWDDLSRMVSAVDSAGRQFAYDYDALGRLVAERIPAGNVLGGTMSYQYDLAGRRTVVQWGTGTDPFVQYERLVTGELSRVLENGPNSGVAPLAVYTYDQQGRRAGVTRGNGTATGWGYADAATGADTPWLTSVTHDLAGTAQDVTRRFVRSAAGEIVSATTSNDAYAYAYDDRDSVDRSYGRNVLNQYTSAGPASFTHDGRGNLSKTTVNTGLPQQDVSDYAYTADNMLVGSSVTTTSRAGVRTTTTGSYAWDPLNRLYGRGASGTVLRYAGEDAVMELDTSGNVRRRWVPGDGADEPLVWYEGAGFSDRRWFHADERGSITAVSTGSGSGSILTYDEYGISGRNNAAVGSRYGYTGQTWLPELGAYHYKARIYSPTLGRFMQMDPIGMAGGMNLYAYVGNDPVNASDPSGLAPLSGNTICTGSRIASSCGGGGVASGLSTTGSLYGGSVFVPGTDGAPTTSTPHQITVTGGRLGYWINLPAFNLGSTYIYGTLAAIGGLEEPQNSENTCALEADRLGKGAGTVAAATVAGAQGGPVGALAGLGIGVGVVLAQDLLPERFGSAIDSAGGAASGGVYGFLASQYDRVFKSVFSNAPGVAQIGGGAVANVAQHVMRTGALTGAVGAARWGAAAGVGYLGGYLATYRIAYNACRKGS